MSWKVNRLLEDLGGERSVDEAGAEEWLRGRLLADMEARRWSLLAAPIPDDPPERPMFGGDPYEELLKALRAINRKVHPAELERLDALERCSAVSLVCAHDAGFREEEAIIYVYDEPDAWPPRGFCYGTFYGERVGDVEYWGDLYG